MADNFDFSGYATKYGVPCSDGRTIKAGAFKHMDGVKIPMVWQHGHNDIENVLGHALLQAREDGVYVYGYFNQTPGGLAAKQAVQHKDIVALSIYANKLLEKNKLVHSGEIREVSLVLSGANPGALIENVSIQHSDGSLSDIEDEVIIAMNIPLDEQETKPEVKHEEVKKEELAHASPPATEGETVQDVFDTLNEKQKTVVYALLGQAMSGNDNLSQSDEQGETFMKKNVFDTKEDGGPSLTHAQMQEFAQAVFNDMPKFGSFKEAFLAHAGTYGIDNISYLFPDARVDGEPDFVTRQMNWVAGWLSGTRHTPFSRIKKLWADLTPDAARAKGYITGNQKVEQVFAMLKRETAPTTVYKKQKLDRDDLVDITDFNVVNWMWKEMRFMLDEEVARAALVGDGRTFGTDDDAIDPSKIRPIYGDDPLFVTYLSLAVTVVDYADIIEAIQLARVNYKGTGTPNLYTTNAVLTNMLLLKDTTNRRIYRSVSELAADLRVADIIEVEVLEGVQRTNTSPAFTADLLGIMVNPRDYTYGADKGGQIATFEDFDIDYNQNKYLIETRLSGSLLNPKSALVIERKTA
jgi:HK97 family phage prohead protease